MTSVKEKAELDAAIAEAELTDEEEAAVRSAVGDGTPIDESVAAVLAVRKMEEPDETAPTTGPEGPTEPTKRQLGALDDETARHVEAVHSIMGGFVDGFEPCPECEALGLVPPRPRPKSHDLFKRCDTCNGYGKVLTGSLEEQHAARNCPSCHGRGYLEKLDAQGSPLVDEEGKPAGSIAPPTAPVEAAGENGGESSSGEERYGAPAWLGDTSIGS